MGLQNELRLVVVRNGQLVLADRAERFFASAVFNPDSGEVVSITPIHEVPDVVIDPQRQFGEPVVRSVPTEVIAEQVRAGEPIDVISELYELSRQQVEAAVRYELICRSSTERDAA